MNKCLLGIASIAYITLLTNRAYAQDNDKTITIPVVFHVLYIENSPDNGINATSRDKGNSSQYLTKEKISAELDDLDKDFQNLNSDKNLVIDEYKKIVGNPKVHFILSEILYQKIDKWGFGTNTTKLHQQSPVKDPEKVLNVYTGVILYRGRGTNGLTPVKQRLEKFLTGDAVNLNYKWVGLHYRLLTHEVGHWLGLWHTFDRSQASLSNINDIPVQKRQTDTDCVKCPPDVIDKGNIAKQAGFTHSNYNNFMDYSGCRVMFSAEQAKYIRHVIRDFRPAIWTSSASKPD